MQAHSHGLCVPKSHTQHTLVLNKTLLTNTLVLDLFKARNDTANSAVFAPDSRNYANSSSVSLPSVMGLFD